MLAWSESHLIQCVGQAGHELGLHKVSVATLELALLLDSERGRLQAELGDLVVPGLQVLQVGGPTLQHRAGVGNAASLDLQVSQALELIVRECLRRLYKRATNFSSRR